jgi:hypothetical protein
MEGQLNDGLIEDFVDFLLPILKPYEATIYLYLLRKSDLGVEAPRIRIGSEL